jgi:hypothetical protein
MNMDSFRLLRSMDSAARQREIAGSQAKAVARWKARKSSTIRDTSHHLSMRCLVLLTDILSRSLLASFRRLSLESESLASCRCNSHSRHHRASLLSNNKLREVTTWLLPQEQVCDQRRREYLERKAMLQGYRVDGQTVCRSAAAASNKGS